VGDKKLNREAKKLIVGIVDKREDINNLFVSVSDGLIRITSDNGFDLVNLNSGKSVEGSIAVNRTNDRIVIIFKEGSKY